MTEHNTSPSIDNSNKAETLTHTALKAFLSKRSVANTWSHFESLISILISGDDTNGLFSIIYVQERKGMEPPPHVHTREDKTFYILEGELLITIGSNSFHAKKGDCVFIPKDIEHSYSLETKEASFLLYITPAGLENYYISLSEQANNIDNMPPFSAQPPELSKVTHAAQICGIQFPFMNKNQVIKSTVNK